MGVTYCDQCKKIHHPDYVCICALPNQLKITMNKKQYIEETLENIDLALSVIVRVNPDGTTIRKGLDPKARKLIQSALSECWDMAEKDTFEYMKKHQEIEKQYGSLTSQKEGKK